jgi:hypothetical protein
MQFFWQKQAMLKPRWAGLPARALTSAGLLAQGFAVRVAQL